MGRLKTDLSPEKDKVQKLRKVDAASTTTPIAVPRIASYLRKLILGMTTILGLGYILPNVATIVVLAYILSTLRISSQEIVFQISGTILFLIASVLLIALGIFIMTLGIRYYKNVSCSDVVFGGVMLASFYLLCLGLGSVLLSPQISLSDVLLVVSPVLIMVSTAAYMVPSFPYRLGGSLLAIVSGVLLAIAIANVPPLSRVLAWKIEGTGGTVPFSGPFMSLTLSEGMVVILGSITALVNSLPYKRKTKPLTHVLFSTMGLVYGISLFIGAFLLSFSFLNIVWKAPWLGPLHGQPSLIFGAVIFWSASLLMLEIGGLVLILVSCLGLAYTAKEFSQLQQT